MIKEGIAMWKPKLCVNPGYINLEEAVRGIIDAGGRVSEDDRGNYVHVTAYLASRNWHLSYDIFQDGHVENVHTDGDNQLRVIYNIR